MAKKLCCILLCLFVVLALGVGGFFLVRQIFRPDVWVNVPYGFEFVLTNDRGETLVVDRDGTGGTMELLDFEGGFAIFRYKVPFSECFTLQTKSDDIAFLVEWGNSGDVFNAFWAKSADKITISQDFILSEGNIINYKISGIVSANPYLRYEMSGDEATYVRLDRAEDAATAESSSGYTLTLSDLRSGEVFAQHDSPDGAAFTLYNSTE